MYYLRYGYTMCKYNPGNILVIKEVFVVFLFNWDPAFDQTSLLLKLK